MGFKLNLTTADIEAASGEFKPLPEAIYGAVIYDASFGTSKAGNPMYTLTYKITDGPEGTIGKTIRGYYTLTKKALFGVVGLNKAVGFPYPSKEWAEANPGEEFEFADPEEYISKKVNLKIVQEPYASVDDGGKDVTSFRNNIKTVTKYNEDAHTGAEGSDTAADTSLFL